MIGTEVDTKFRFINTPYMGAVPDGYLLFSVCHRAEKRISPHIPIEGGMVDGFVPGACFPNKTR